MDAEYLRSILSYDPDTGDFRWLINKARARVGDAAGTVRGDGYRQIMIAQRRYYSHRLAWLYVHGRWPTEQIDHIDGDPSNNKLANLREATETQNKCNRGVNVTNTSGFKGVSWNKAAGAWHAHIRVDGRYTHLGTFSCPKEAHRAYVVAALLHHGEFANIG